VFWGEAFPAVGLLGAIFSGVTVYCTSMIYASLKSVDAWHTPLTSACYLAFAASGGLTAASFFALVSRSVHAPFIVLAASAVSILAWIVRSRWQSRIKTMQPRSTPESATGLGSLGRVRLFEPPHMTGNYLTNEMGFKIARKHAEKLFWIAVACGGALPVLLLSGAVLAEMAALHILAALLGGIALVAHIAGLFVERWLFFAQARHSVMNYYGS
jgi:DMSO reductase anchor subunit